MVIYLFASNSLMLLWQISNYMILEVCFVFLFLFFITFYSFLCWGMCVLVEMRDNLWGSVLFFYLVGPSVGIIKEAHERVTCLLGNTHSKKAIAFLCSVSAGSCEQNSHHQPIEKSSGHDYCLCL